MKNKRRKLISVMFALMMCMFMMSVNAYADDAVAKIGSNMYTTFADALDAANSRSEETVITLLQDCTSDTLITSGTLNQTNKDITINLAGHTLTIDRTFTNEEWYQNGYGVHGKLTFKNGNIKSAEQLDPGETFTVAKTGVLSFVECNVDVGGNETYTVVYNNGVVNITGGIFKVSDTSGTGDAFHSDNNNSKFNIKNAEIIIDKTSRFDVLATTVIEDSTVRLTNLRAIGMNAANTTMRNSNLTMDGVVNHGYTNGVLKMYDSTMSLNNCGNIGANVQKGSLLDNSKLTITNCGGIETSGRSALVVGYSNSKSDASLDIINNSVLKVTDNKQGGIYVSGTLNQDTTSKVTVTNNEITEKVNSFNLGKGGGISNIGTVTLQNNAVLYNNHAVVAGDDIYNTGEISVGETGSGWALDGNYDECKHLIDGWYDDSEETRWEAHAETDEENHIVKFAASEIAVGAYKAAHGLNAEDDPNAKKSEPDLSKVIVQNDDEVKETTLAAGAKVKFKLTSHVPDDLADKIVYSADAPVLLAAEGSFDGTYRLIFHDQMDEKLINPMNFIIVVGEKNITDQTDSDGNNYYVILDDEDIDDGCTFEIIVDLAKLYTDEIITKEDFGITEITVTYTATLSDDAAAGTYRNTAWVTYPEEGKSEEDVVTVDTYGIKLFKYDQATATSSEANEWTADGLAGAEFELKDDTGHVIATLISDKEGYAIYEGLDVGTYILTEKKAPGGYVKNDTPLEIIVPDNAGVDNIVEVRFANKLIPHTGGSGTRMYTIAGVGIIVAAGVFFVITRKKKED
ncbi:MAG: SpaA isopeptide-forming pilin-related protein [Lachnospiraceae bacterium]